ncbi:MULTISPECIES: hypothetical protein [Cryobacterium]|uniref:Pentapeptide repeat-containing protein n=1 Tax=Cryobacterium breve TaxID=1259258 RepID=A0ABY2J9A5_9MICO|nr:MULTISPECIES: hypothetical protein [Cryobacterium]TFC95148.1 hypothetical protein E3T20_05945 [Cryobacterium sp. TmT3-12]TFD00396.1 hypothetical protein E3O65_04720 [Cryobacterium breve]
MARAKTRGPQLDRIVLDGLTDADGSDLRAGDSREAERFTELDLSGRNVTGIGFQECELHGVSFSDTQLSLPVPILAAHLGILVTWVLRARARGISLRANSTPGPGLRFGGPTSTGSRRRMPSVRGSRPR